MNGVLRYSVVIWSLRRQLMNSQKQAAAVRAYVVSCRCNSVMMWSLRGQLMNSHKQAAAVRAYVPQRCRVFSMAHEADA